MAFGLDMESLRALLGYFGSVNYWKVLAVIFAIFNLKNLPFAWHLRVLNAFITHLYHTRSSIPPPSSPSRLFQPMIIKTRVTSMDCDWNLHKSNSTYFGDLDIARAHLVAHICRRGMVKIREELKADKGGLGLGLGGVHCSFRREIKPFERFEIWTRVLAWDRKWLYVVSHLVKEGKVKPKAYSLQPWRKVKGTRSDKKEEGSASVQANGNSEAPAQPHPAIFASAIGKYVFKKGRLTIAPSRILEASGYLPPKPADVPTPAATPSPMPEGATNIPDSTSQEPALAAAVEALSSKKADGIVNGSLSAKTRTDGVWDWYRVEDERIRGMRLAEMFSGLDGLSGEFRGEDDDALGMFRDLF
ncbi:MAG: hypothetical protein Q9191_004215 [Dirinaria sp. TL-2023a]